MKNLISKISVIFIGLLVLSLVQVSHAYALEATQSVDEILFDKLLAESSTSRSAIKPDTIWESSKGNERGQNLYLSVTNEMSDKPLKEAIKTASREFSLPNAKTGEQVFFTEAEWRDIYLKGTTASISENLSLVNNSIKDTYANTMIQYIEDEMDNNRFLAELTADSAATEIATDMLMPDFEFMELILFGQIEASTYDNARAAVNLPPTSTLAESESGDTAHTSSEAAATESSASTASAPKSPADQSFADDAKEFPTTSSESSAILYNPTGLNPLQCDSDTNIDDALDDYFGDLPPKNPFSDLIPPRTGDGTSEPPVDSDGGRPPTADDTGSFDGTDDSDTTAEDGFDEIAPAEGHDWINEELCITDSKIFCIEVRFINNGQECEFGEGSTNNCAGIGPGLAGSGNSQSGYAETDNCIACHAKFMLENMDLLLSKTLTPSKAPGNLLESGKCKKGFLKTKPSLNIYAIKKPIPAPQESDPLFQSNNPFEDFRREMTEGFGFGKGERADAVTRHTVAFSGTRNASSIFAEIDDANVAREKELAFNKEMALLQQDLDSYAKGYGDLSMQIETTTSLVSALDQMNNDINANSCEALRSKKTCD
ncbi:MAG: hypothetical protein Q8P68_01455 [Candidatus Peregrinibacteria bacterium]|nr:hypothetical protein [Candidatus Peregrinibacteria bacterium]MDZ4244297.1 hypothetical protein [Candidatus Gracilibacteria bacterium]